MNEESLSLHVSEPPRQVSALETRPPSARWGLVLAHGAGAGMQHAFMAALTARLVDRGTAVLRYQFPYMEDGRRRPDPPARLIDTVRGAVSLARERFAGLPLFAGGKSMGGRMTSRAEADQRLPGVCGLVFVGFPLHPADRPGIERAEHLSRVAVPTLFLQGTRDKLAYLDLVRSVTGDLDGAEVHVVDGADHGFHVLKRSGRTDDDVLDELADVTVAWMSAVAIAQ